MQVREAVMRSLRGRRTWIAGIVGAAAILAAHDAGVGSDRASNSSDSGTGPAISGGALLESNRVSAGGSYQTSVTISVLEGPMAPDISLVYDSGSSGGVA